VTSVPIAGSSPVAPVENILQIRIFCCRFWRDRPPAFQPVTPLIPPANPNAVRDVKGLQITMFSGRARGQGLRPSRADPASRVASSTAEAVPII
jgi:hypothetical protein